MTLEEIKAAIESGKHVCWSNRAYDVIKDKLGQWLIVCGRSSEKSFSALRANLNGYTCGLTWLDGVTMNGNPDEFFTV